MRRNLTILPVLAVLASGFDLALPAHAQTTDGRGIQRNPAITDQSSRNAMMGQMSEMMENCNNMMRNMQGYQSPMLNQQGTGPTNPRNGN